MQNPISRRRWRCWSGMEEKAEADAEMVAGVTNKCLHRFWVGVFSHQIMYTLAKRIGDIRVNSNSRSRLAKVVRNSWNARQGFITLITRCNQHFLPRRLHMVTHSHALAAEVSEQAAENPDSCDPYDEALARIASSMMLCARFLSFLSLLFLSQALVSISCICIFENWISMTFSETALYRALVYAQYGLLLLQHCALTKETLFALESYADRFGGMSIIGTMQSVSCLQKKGATYLVGKSITRDNTSDKCIEEGPKEKDKKDEL